MDSNGDLIDVDENNQMGYFINCGEYHFSNTQKIIIQTDFLSSPRSYLRTGHIPDLDPVDNAVVYTYPINGEETPTFDNIELDWEDHPGATDYLVILDRSPTFSLAPMRLLVNQSLATIPDLLPNINYYWRVWPFNESKTGAGWASTQTFHTGIASAVKTISSVEYVDVFPNPVVSSDEIFVRLQSNEVFEAHISLFDLTGKQVQVPLLRTIEAAKENHIAIKVADIASGLYFLQIRSAEGGIISRKISIQ
jgi:hypothetical protein